MDIDHLRWRCANQRRELRRLNAAIMRATANARNADRKAFDAMVENDSLRAEVSRLELRNESLTILVGDLESQVLRVGPVKTDV